MFWNYLPVAKTFTQELQSVHSGNLIWIYATSLGGAIAADKELTRQIQIRLTDLGLLDPPADGIFGSVSTVGLNGEWFASGYNNHANGAYLHYCYDLIRRVGMADGNFRVHFISK